jgi:hypothetical protein
MPESLVDEDAATDSILEVGQSSKALSEEMEDVCVLFKHPS